MYGDIFTWIWTYKNLLTTVYVWRESHLFLCFGGISVELIRFHRGITRTFVLTVLFQFQSIILQSFSYKFMYQKLISIHVVNQNNVGHQTLDHSQPPYDDVINRIIWTQHTQERQRSNLLFRGYDPWVIRRTLCKIPDSSTAYLLPASCYELPTDQLWNRTTVSTPLERVKYPGHQSFLKVFWTPRMISSVKAIEQRLLCMSSS